jgi:predicted  nucleic acid-binding Zn-ribbon protein
MSKPPNELRSTVARLTAENDALRNQIKKQNELLYDGAMKNMAAALDTSEKQRVALEDALIDAMRALTKAGGFDP